MKFRTGFLRGGTLAALVGFLAAGATAETNTLSEAEIQGRALAQKILAQWPAEDSTNTGVFQIRDANGNRSEIPVECKTMVTATNWQSLYRASRTNKVESLLVIHTAGQLNAYGHNTSSMPGQLFSSPKELSDAETMIPFAGSDFSLGDLGLEFFHWPEQTILKKEFYRQCPCTVLESTNPHPSAGGYSRVMTWIDNDSLGIVEAYAYDVNGKKLKDFYPKDFKKVDGQWQVQTLMMENLQTGSRTRLEFDLKKRERPR